MPELSSDPEAPFYEVVRGETVWLPAMNVRDHITTNRIGLHLANFVQPLKLGEVTFLMLFDIDSVNNIQRRPEVAFVSTERWPLGRRIPPGDAWQVVPDLVVEVVTEGEQAVDLIAKVDEYFQAGVKRVWWVFPELGRTLDFESPLVSRWYGANEPVPGGNLLPGFSFRLDEIL